MSASIKRSLRTLLITALILVLTASCMQPQSQTSTEPTQAPVPTPASEWGYLDPIVNCLNDMWVPYEGKTPGYYPDGAAELCQGFLWVAESVPQEKILCEVDTEDLLAAGELPKECSYSLNTIWNAYAPANYPDGHIFVALMMNNDGAMAFQFKYTEIYVELQTFFHAVVTKEGFAAIKGTKTGIVTARGDTSQFLLLENSLDANSQKLNALKNNRYLQDWYTLVTFEPPAYYRTVDNSDQ